MQPHNQHVLITGATSCIGYELAKLFAKDGYNLVIVARTQEDLDRTANELKQQYNVNVISLSKDLFDPENAFQLYDEVIFKNITVDVLLNDAGQG